MDAFILHAEGDEAYALDMGQRIAPSRALDAPLASAGAYTFGDHLFVLALWSARAEAQGLARQLADVARAVGDRCIVVRIDGTPLPAIAGTAQVAVYNGRENEFGAMLKVARMRARPAPPAVAATSRAMPNGIGPGVGVGLAIYAGMFVAAGAWRSEDITQAMDAGAEAPAVVALRSFQTAFDAPETAHVALASAEPNARFVQPQRVIVTASMDTSQALPVLAPKADTNTAELAPVEIVRRAPAIEKTPLAPVSAVTPTFSGMGASSLTLIALDGVNTFDVTPNEAF